MRTENEIKLDQISWEIQIQLEDLLRLIKNRYKESPERVSEIFDIYCREVFIHSVDQLKFRENIL